MTTLQQESRVIRALKQKMREKDTRLTELQGKLKETRKDLEEFKKQFPDSSSQIQSRESRIGRIEQEIRKLQNELASSTNSGSLQKKIEQAERVERAGFRQANVNSEWYIGLVEPLKAPTWLRIYTLGIMLFIGALLPLAILLPLFFVGDPHENGSNVVAAFLCSILGWPIISIIIWVICAYVRNAVVQPCPVFQNVVSHTLLTLARETTRKGIFDFVFIASSRREDFIKGFAQPLNDEESADTPRLLGVLMCESDLRFFSGCDEPKQFKYIPDAFFYDIDKDTT